MSTHPEVRINQSVAILIDGNNIEKGLQKLANDTNALLDFDKIIPKLLQDRGLKRLIYFREGISISDKLAERLLTNYHGSVVPCHKSADIPLTIMATQIAPKVDTIIILSGDSDYVELVRHLKGEGVRTEIAAVQHATARILVDEVEHFTPITLEDCYILKVPGRSTSKSRPSTTKRTTTTSKSSSKPTSKSTSKPSSNPSEKSTSKPPAESTESKTTKATKSRSKKTVETDSKEKPKRTTSRRKPRSSTEAITATEAPKETLKKATSKRAPTKKRTSRPQSKKVDKSDVRKVEDWDDLSF